MMPPRSVAGQDIATQNSGNPLAVLGGEAGIEDNSPIAEPAEPVVEAQPPVAVNDSDNAVMFADAWVKSVRNQYNHTLIDMFLFECQKNGWAANTPSGWLERFTRWSGQ